MTPAINFSLFGFFLNDINDTMGTYKLFTGVNDTGDKFFAGVVDTAEQLINIIREYLRKFSKKIKKAPMEYLGAWGTLIHEKT